MEDRTPAAGGQEPPLRGRGARPGFATRAIHEAEHAGQIAEQPVSPPIWLTSDYLYEGLDHYADVISGRRAGYVYGRYGNPTHVALHNVLASLEQAEAAWSFASGMAAVHTSLTSLLAAGDHMVAQRTLYGGSYSLFTTVFPRYGIEVTFADAESDAVAAAICPSTRVVLIETLANPTFRVADLPGIASVCVDRGVALVVDNTVASPYLLRPLELPGVTLVLHSTSKYIGGHSDVIGGVVAGDRSRIEGIRRFALDQGATAGSFEAWLTLRGIQTLSMRMARQCETALLLAEALSSSPAVKTVGYCGLPGHEDHGRASELFRGRGYGAMLSLELVEGFAAAARACEALRVARVGSSFGGLHTQVCHPATTSHRQLPPEERSAAGIGDGLLRVAVGGEDADDLVPDFIQALEKT
ncbi:MAG: aminotransferase class I/II-fold pyridoxal phosphate-dependent enzyme [Actinobacteria bacterium]|nr:aminotransferase class I/II-fold pyridoxal phosphate-dependent enzyme [Actinomycetota bacterium]